MKKISATGSIPLAEFQTTSVRALIKKDDEILVEWFAPKNIAFLPGGTIELGENLHTALQRELAEELTGTELTIGRYLGEIGHRWKTPTGIESCLNHFFEVAASHPELLRAQERGREIRWVQLNPDQISNLQPPSLKRFILSKSNQADWKVLDSEISS